MVGQKTNQKPTKKPTNQDKNQLSLGWLPTPGEEATVEVDPESETYKVTKKILDVLYATADGFEVPEEGVEGFCN